MSVKRHGLFGMTQLGSQGTVRRQSASVEFDEPSILLENLLEDVLLIVDEQQRAVCCVPYAPVLLIAT